MRYQYTAIDDATRIKAWKIYDRHAQAKAIAFINPVTARFPFRVRGEADNGYEFQAKFHRRSRHSPCLNQAGIPTAER